MLRGGRADRALSPLDEMIVRVLVDPNKGAGVRNKGSLQADGPTVRPARLGGAPHDNTQHPPRPRLGSLRARWHAFGPTCDHPRRPVRQELPDLACPPANAGCVSSRHVLCRPPHVVSSATCRFVRHVSSADRRQARLGAQAEPIDDLWLAATYPKALHLPVPIETTERLSLSRQPIPIATRANTSTQLIDARPCHR